MLDLGAHVVCAEDPLLDEERDHRHLQDLVVGEGGIFEVRLGRMVMGRVHVVPAVSVPMVVSVVVPVGLSAGVFVSTHFTSPETVTSSETGSSQCS